MARPPKAGPKKEGISVSATPAEKFSVSRRARVLGFPNPARYLLALHEAENRLQLHSKPNHRGERWFVKSPSDPVPEDITVEDAIQALVDDRDDLGKVTPLPGADTPAAAVGFVENKLRELERTKNSKTTKSPRPAH